MILFKNAGARKGLKIESYFASVHYYLLLKLDANFCNNSSSKISSDIRVKIRSCCAFFFERMLDKPVFRELYSDGLIEDDELLAFIKNGVF